ncbi:MAG: glucosyltransferase, partial [Bradyrhizobiaceae bacterium]|nr:glucosyltransferase [Bradyrhizobiaceae bacterium]
VSALAAIGTASIGPLAALGLCAAAFGCRMAVLRQVERAFDLTPQSVWLVPLRDVVSFAVFIASLFGQSARWRGRRYRFIAGGTLVPAGSSSRS